LRSVSANLSKFELLEFRKLPLAIFILSWSPLVAQLTGRGCFIGLGINDIVILSEVWNEVVLLKVILWGWRPGKKWLPLNEVVLDLLWSSVIEGGS